MDENNLFGYSHKTIITRALVHTALWWPCWWLNEWIMGLGIHALGLTLGKLIFYANGFFMTLFWFLAYSIAKGTKPTDKEIVKYLFFWLIIHIIMEIPLLMSQN